MIYSLRHNVSTLLLLTVRLVHPTFAQAQITLTGTVTDQSGGVLAGATVVASAGIQRVTTLTEPDGRFRLNLPSEGPYRMTVGREGFAVLSEALNVSVGVTRDFQLAIAPLDDTVVVTASATPEGRASTTDPLMVFTAQEIQRSGSSSLGGRRATGARVARRSERSRGCPHLVFARGGESDYNHVLVDGVRVNISGGQFDFSRLSAGEIERVEVVRGAQSALYGSDAIGSVVQIFTKRGLPTDTPHVSGSFEGGSFGTARGDTWLRGGAGQRLDYQLGLARGQKLLTPL
jgi:outer membrane receptor protein involved in Fe transport